jgi:class 3 adenylate cyclase/CHASE2 domain-containing sensor protein
MEETRANPKKAPPPAPAAQVKNRAEVMARVQWGIGLAITAAVAVLWWAGLMQRFEFPLVDEYMRRFYSAAPPPANDLCIIAIDDGSLENTKRWPWPRDMQARVIDELRRAGAKVVALDLLLNNPEPGPRFDAQSDVSRPRGAAGGVAEAYPDRTFGEAIAEHGGVVLGAEFPFLRSEKDVASKNAKFADVYRIVKEKPDATIEDLRVLLKGKEEQAATDGARFDDLRAKLAACRTLISRREDFSIPVPPDGAAGGGIEWMTTEAPELPAAGIFESAAQVSTVTATGIGDTDGMLRRMPLWVRHDDRLYPTLGLAATARFLDVPVSKMRIERNFTVIPTRRGDIRLEMHTADLTGHSHTDGLFYLAWPTGASSFRQFSPNKHSGASNAPGAKIIRGESPSGSASFDDADDDLIEGDEVPIGYVYEPAIVERRIKQNIEDTDRALLRMEVTTKAGEENLSLQGITLFDGEDQKQKHIARANMISRTPMDTEGWVDAVQSHLRHAAALRDVAEGNVQAFADEEARVVKGLAAPLSEKDCTDWDNCQAYINASMGAERQVQAGLKSVQMRRANLRKHLNSKLCLIGWNAVGSIADFVPTSIDVKTPGPYLHAAVANSILTGHQKLVSAPAITGVGLGSIILMGVIGTMLGIRIGVLVSPLALVGCMAAWALMAGYIVFDRWNAVTAFASPIAAAGVSWLGVTLHRLLVEQRGRKQTEARFRSYVSPDVVDILVNNPDLQSMAPQKRELTIMFSDVANWTTLTERLGTEGIFQFLSKYLGEMTDIIQKNKATLDKYLGDGIMAFWGAPIEDPDHAKNASIACVEMLERLGEMNRTNAFGDAGTVEVRFGIATGEVNVGDFGNPPHKSAYTVIGDAVNLAARLESSNKQFGTSILMTKRVVDLSGSTLLFRPIGRIVVKGKTEYDELYELIGDRRPKGERTLEWIKATNDAVGAFQAGRLDEAAGLFSTLDSDFGDSKLAKLYLHAIEELMASGIPDGWEGTLVLTEK